MRRRIRTAAAAGVLLAAQLVVLATGSQAAQALPASANLTETGTFTDTFAGSTDKDPYYGLNIGLDARQTGTAKASYTRLSGLWNTAQPPKQWFTQVNHPSYPNKLAFFLGTSAVMLGAPAVADGTGHYTISTTIDPVVGDTTSTDWGSLVLSRSRMSWGYATNSDVDLALIVRSSGALTLFSKGSQLWTGAVPAAGGYQVSMTVSTGADKRVALTVNGAPFIATGPAAGPNWPSSPYLYLGAYLSNSSSVTTFGSGSPGEGLSVSSVDRSIAGSGQLFADTFDGVTDDPTTYGLNSSREARQPGAVANSYTRTSGLGTSSTPPQAWYSQVNHPNFANKLGFFLGPSAVRLDKPLVAGLDGAYATHAVLDPVVGDTASTDWESVMLSASRTSNGWVAGADTALGLRIRSNGHWQLYQAGVATYGSEQQVTPAADGSFDLTITAVPATGNVTIVINGVRADVTTSPLPVTAYLSIGQNTVDSAEVSTVDNLRMSKLGNLTGYGYFDIMDPTDRLDHSWQVSGYTNANQYLADVTLGYLDYCRPHSCTVLAQWEQFTATAVAGVWVPDPNSDQLVTGLRNDIGANLDKVSALYLVDEPYDKHITGTQLQAAADQLRHYFPHQQIMLTLSGPSVALAGSSIPSGVDWVGFDWYCQSSTTLSNTLHTLEGKLPTPYQQLFLMPESAPGMCNSSDAGIAARQDVYTTLAAADPRVAALVNFGWWLGTNGLGSDKNPLVDLRTTSAKQLGIGQSILGVG